MGLINARGSSKGIHRKNLHLLGGKPLIYYAIRAGKESKLVDRVVVSTEDEEIAEVAKEYGAEVPFKRPKELAGDNVTQYPPTKHAIFELKELGWFPDIVVILIANVPFKRGEDVDRVIKTLIESDADSVRSVCEVSTPPHWMYTLDKNKLLKPFVETVEMEDPKSCIRQNLPKIYQVTGLVDVAWTKTISNTGSLFGKKVKACVFSPIKSIDIDTPEDMMIAEAIMRSNKC